MSDVDLFNHPQLDIIFDDAFEMIYDGLLECIREKLSFDPIDAEEFYSYESFLAYFDYHHLKNKLDLALCHLNHAAEEVIYEPNPRFRLSGYAREYPAKYEEKYHDVFLRKSVD
jgi:hypothetical protein